RSSPGVTLSSVHRVKGLEWPCVILAGIDRDLLPHRLAEDFEEERRVFHVGLTRGREQVLVLADRSAPSAFIAEMQRARSPGRRIGAA
ncbi:MAG: 3'-5' exonuclease, partial [Candidatus Xenobia bacterium]